MGSQDQPLATVGILSIGDMGLGIARLLMAHGYRVLTNVTGRSPATQARATKHKIIQVDTDIDLVNQSDYILSIVPPRDAIATAERIATAASDSSFPTRKHPLVFLDLNAISPSSARQIEALFASQTQHVTYLDGGIIGGPPSPPADPSEGSSDWDPPSIPISGPLDLSQSTTLPSAPHFAHTLHLQHISPSIGPATGLKMCFAALSKGFTALAIQSFSTAHNLGVLEELKAQLAEHNPNALRTAQRGLPGMCPKAYRWVREMEEIAGTMEEEGGFEASESSFRSVARIYELVANGTVLGEEKVGERVRGKTAEEVAALICEGTRKRKEKMD